MAVTIKPINDKVVVKEILTKTSLFKTPKVENSGDGMIKQYEPKPYALGEVLAVGEPLYKNPNDVSTLKQQVKPGMIVAFDKGYGQTVTVGEEVFQMVSSWNICAVIEGVDIKTLQESENIKLEELIRDFAGRESAEGLIEIEIQPVRIWEGLSANAMKHMTESALNSISAKSEIPPYEAVKITGESVGGVIVGGKFREANDIPINTKMFPLAEPCKILVPFKETIKKVGKKFVLFSKDGMKELGTHDTYADALAQEQAIIANKK